MRQKIDFTFDQPGFAAAAATEPAAVRIGDPGLQRCRQDGRLLRYDQGRARVGDEDPEAHRRYSAGAKTGEDERAAWAASGGLKRLSLSAFATTLTLDAAMARPANTGDIRMPKAG